MGIKVGGLGGVGRGGGYQSLDYVGIERCKV